MVVGTTKTGEKVNLGTITIVGTKQSSYPSGGPTVPGSSTGIGSTFTPSQTSTYQTTTGGGSSGGSSSSSGKSSGGSSKGSGGSSKGSGGSSGGSSIKPPTEVYSSSVLEQSFTTKDALLQAEKEYYSKGSYDISTKTYTDPKGNKQSMLPDKVPEGTQIIKSSKDVITPKVILPDEKKVTPIYENVLDTKKYQAHIEKESKVFDEETIRRTKESEKKLRLKQEEERKRTTVKEKTIAVAGSGFDFMNLGLKKKRLEKYEGRQKSLVGLANVEAEKDFSERKEKFLSDMESSKGSFVSRQKVGERVEVVSYELPVLSEEDEAFHFFSEKGVSVYDVSETGLPKIEENSFVVPNKKISSTQSSVIDLLPSTKFEFDSKSLLRMDTHTGFVVPNKLVPNEINFESSKFVVPTSQTFFKNIQDLRLNQATASFDIAVSEFRKPLTESRLPVKLGAVTDFVRSTTEIFNPLEEKNVFFGAVKTPSFVVGTTATTLGGLFTTSSVVGDVAGKTIVDYYSGKDPLKQTLKIPLETHKFMVGTAIPLVGGVVGYQVATGFPIVKETASGTIDTFFENPIRAGAEAVTIGYLAGPIVSKVGKVLEPVTKPFTNRAGKVVDYVFGEKVLPESVLSVASETRSPLIGLGNDSSFVVKGESVSLLKTQSKASGFLYELTGSKRFAPKVYTLTSDYGFDVVPSYNLPSKNPLGLRSEVSGLSDVELYRFAGMQGVGFNSPNVLRGAPFNVYGEKLTDEAFSQLGFVSTSFLSNLTGRSGFESSGLVKSSLLRGGKNVLSDVRIVKNLSDVFGSKNAVVRSAFSGGYVESPIFSTFEGVLTSFEEGVPSKLVSSGLIDVSGFGVGKQVISNNVFGEAFVDVKYLIGKEKSVFDVGKISVEKIKSKMKPFDLGEPIVGKQVIKPVELSMQVPIVDVKSVKLVSPVTKTISSGLDVVSKSLSKVEFGIPKVLVVPSVKVGEPIKLVPKTELVSSMKIDLDLNQKNLVSNKTKSSVLPKQDSSLKIVEVGKVGEVVKIKSAVSEKTSVGSKQKIGLVTELKFKQTEKFSPKFKELNLSQVVPRETIRPPLDPIVPIPNFKSVIESNKKSKISFFGKVPKARKSEPVFRLKSDLFRKFALSEKDLLVSQKSVKLRNVLWKRQGSFQSFIPTKELIKKSGSEKNYLKKIGFNFGGAWAI